MSEAARVGLVVARFEPVVELGLGAVLSEDGRLRVLESGLGHSELSRAVVRLAPQVAILDEAAERAARAGLRAIQPTMGILVFAHQPTAAYGMALLRVGAACVARSAPAAEILAAVQLVAQGERVFTTADGERIERCYPDAVPVLTRREQQVFERLSQGMPHAAIAHDLKIGVRTVHTYASQICRKLGVRSKRELIGMPAPAAPR